MLISYTVKLTVLNNITNSSVIFNKNFESEITALNDNVLYDNYHVLHNSIYVLDLFSQEVKDYCEVEEITSDDIVIDEYEITTLTENVEVFFENPVDVNAFTLKPDIKCYIYPKEQPLPVPILQGTSYDSNTIIWTWPEDEQYAHYLISEPVDFNSEDDKTKIIATIPIGAKHYIETGLEPNTAYSRRLINYTDTQTSLPSAEVTVTTETVNPQISLDKYYIEREHDWSITDSEREVVKENLTAFKSGIGDFNDLKVYKQMDKDFYEKFKAYFTLTGKYTQREKRYEQVGFNYKVCLEAKETIEEQEGEVTFKLDAYPWQEMYKTEYLWAIKPVTVYAKVYASIDLFKTSTETKTVTKTITYKEKEPVLEPITFIISIDLSTSMRYTPGGTYPVPEGSYSRLAIVKKAAKEAINDIIEMQKSRGQEVEIIIRGWANTKWTKKFRTKKYDDSVKYDIVKSYAKKVVSDMKVDSNAGYFYTRNDYSLDDDDANLVKTEHNLGSWTNWGKGLDGYADADSEYSDPLYDRTVLLFYTDGFANTYFDSNGTEQHIARGINTESTVMNTYIRNSLDSSIDALWGIFSCKSTVGDPDYPTGSVYNNSIINVLKDSSICIGSDKDIDMADAEDGLDTVFKNATKNLSTRYKEVEKTKNIDVEVNYVKTDYKTVTIESEPLSFTFDATKTQVAYNENTKQAEVIQKLSATKMSEKSVLQLLREAKEAHPDWIAGYNQNSVIKDENGNIIGDVYKNIYIKDTYSYGDEDPIPSLTFNTNYDYGMMGTINVNATIPNLSTTDNTDDEYVASDSAYVWISGYTNAIIYDCTRYGHVAVNAYSRPQETMFFKGDLATLLKNRENKNFTYGSDNIDSSHIFKIDLELKIPDPSYMQIYGDGINSDLVVSISEHWQSPILNYKFNLLDPDAYTPYYEILPDCYPQSQDKHVIIITVYYAKNVEINSTALNDNYYDLFDYTNPVQNPLEFKYGLNATWNYETNVYDCDGHWISQFIHFFARKMKKTQDYYDELPGPNSGIDSMYGLVNGRYREDNLSGKQDLIVDTPKFNIPTTVLATHADTIKIYIKITEFYPENALVSYKWHNESPIGSGYTKINGDYVTFSSDSITYKDIDYHETLATYETEQIEMFSQDPLEMMQAISKPDNTDKYSNYYLKVETDNGDVLATRYPTEIVFGDDDSCAVPVTYRGVINATSMWSPRIHNGYYYTNQHERHLYTEFDVEADFDTTEETYYTEATVFINFDVNMKKDGGSIENYSINKNTSVELLQDEDYFIWEQNKGLTLKPIIEGQEYKHYEAHTWYSPIMLFDNPLTTANELNLEYLNTDGSNTGLELYVRSFDLENGTWTDWTEFENNTVPNTMLNSAYQLKAILSATEEHTEYQYDDYLCCYLDWIDYIDENVSENIVTVTDHITTGTYNSSGVAVSQIIQYACETGIVLDMFTSDDSVTMNVAYSNDINDLILENIKWQPMSAVNINMGYKYYRFKIIIPKNEKVYWVHLSVNTLKTEAVLPYIKSISMTGSYEPEAITGHFMKLETFNITKDGLYHEVVPQISDYISSEVIKRGFELTDIESIDIKSTNPDVTLLFDTDILKSNPDPSLLSGSIQAAATEATIDTINQLPYIFTKYNKITIKGTPQQYCPITVEDVNGIPLKEIYNVNPDDMLVTEIYTMKTNENYVELKRNDFELETMTVWINDDEITDYNIVNHLLMFKNFLDTDDVVTVTYNIKNSFYTEIDRENNTTVITIYTDKNTNSLPDEYDEIIDDTTTITHKKKFKVMFETNKQTNKFIAKKLSLNPVYRTDYSGFIYLTEEHNVPYKIKIWCNPKRVKAGGLDSVDIQIEVLDIIDNPVIAKEVKIDCNNGTLICDNYETDMNGVVHAVYKSSYLTGIDIITAKVLLDDELTNLQESIEITSY